MNIYWVLVGLHEFLGKVVFVFPPQDSNFPALGTRKGRNFKGNLGLLRIAGYLVEKLGYSFSMARLTTKEDVAKLLRNAHVGISSGYDNYHNSIELSELARDTGARSIILGGSYISTRARQIARKYPHINLVTIGQGEKAVCEMIKSQDCGKNHIVASGKDSYTPLRCLSTPLYEKWPIDHAPLFRGRKTALVYWGDGCGQALSVKPCLFCSICHQAPRLNCKTVKQVVEEMKLLENLGFGAVEVGSDDFPSTVSIKWLRELVSLIENGSCLKLDVYIHSRARPLKNTEKIDLLIRMGVKVIQTGFETGNTEIKSRSMNNKSTMDEEDALVDLCAKNGIYLHPSFTIGLPGETLSSLKQTTDRIQTILGRGVINTFQFDLLMPLPGSESFDLLCKNHSNWAEQDFVPLDELSKAWFAEFTNISFENAVEVRQRMIDCLPPEVFVGSFWTGDGKTNDV
ncbi:MAG: radical SAM protein [Patescibacteria group bacterium]|nr:radical SAM protein [Patescibacteria group bacterium]